MHHEDPLNPHLGEPQRQRSGCLTAALVLAAAATLSILGTIAGAWLLTARISDQVKKQALEVAERIEKNLGFRPEVRVDGVVLIGALQPAAEIVTATTEILARERWSHTWLGSTKRIELEAVFVARAGFTADKPFRIGLDGRTGAIGADFPTPRLLSLEMGDPKILRDEDGLWNKLTEADREEAFRRLRAQAREQAETSDFLHRARKEFEARVKALLQGQPLPTEETLPSSPLSGQFPWPSP